MCAWGSYSAFWLSRSIVSVIARLINELSVSPFCSARSKERIGKVPDKVLNKEETVELFEKEAILFGTSDVIPFYRAIELFGEEAAGFFYKRYRKGTKWVF
jgi:hypothetical protein